MKQFFLRLEFRRAREGSVARFIVPRTYILADVAPEDVMSDLLSEFQGNLAALFNRKVSDAPTGVQFTGSHDSSGRTSLNASATTSATVLEWDSRRKLDRSN